MPAFSRLQTKYGANGVQFVGIALDTADNVKTFSQQQPVSYPLLIADSESTELTRELGNSRLALPYTLVLGPRGDVQLVRLGRIAEQELEALLAKIAQLQ
jgi:peroxiredoxin